MNPILLQQQVLLLQDSKFRAFEFLENCYYRQVGKIELTDEEAKELTNLLRKNIEFVMDRLRRNFLDWYREDREDTLKIFWIKYGVFQVEKALVEIFLATERHKERAAFILTDGHKWKYTQVAELLKFRDERSIRRKEKEQEDKRDLFLDEFFNIPKYRQIWRFACSMK